jgi:hypothetical protein
VYFADRFAVADMNGDFKTDIVVSEERWPEPENASVYWFEQPENPRVGKWERHTVVTQNTSNNLDVADMDADGDFDIITAEHRGTKKTTVWENAGNGEFKSEHIVSSGKEGHLGARIADMDGDGDYDILSIAWDDYTYLHLWRNDSDRTFQNGFVPGDIFREYKWNGPWVNAGKWQRVTDSDAGAGGAKEFLPNPVNSIAIDDLDGAERAEVQIEMLMCHAGTSNKRIRIGKGDWLRIPEAYGIPGGRTEAYQSMTYPIVTLPLSSLKTGENTFELTAGRQIYHDFNWGQSIIYGATFRIYYDDSKEHPTGRIISPEPGSTIGENPAIRVDATSRSGIRQVDFIAYYEDFNYKGDNNWRGWQYAFHYGELIHHIGTVKEQPYMITWDTSWIPDQNLPIKIMARITDNNGISYITPAVERVKFERETGSVRLYRPYDVPERWATRAGATHSCKVSIRDDLNRAAEAKMMLVNWDGYLTDEIGINGQKIVKNTGLDHDISYNEISIPLDMLKPGMNMPYTYSATEHHGIEVNWPGIALKIRYEK